MSNIMAGLVDFFVCTRKIFLTYLIFLLTLLFAGCASSVDTTSALNTDPPEKMYADADNLMPRGKFDAAASKFEDLDRSHPYSPEARRAMVLAAYAYYRAGK
ncbi:MAG: outer membrane protein assembly factor BamD, partial [Hyphomicrobium sp.]